MISLYFQAIKAALTKHTGPKRPPEEIDAAIRQLVSGAIMAGDEVIDVFSAAGLGGVKLFELFVTELTNA
jgi:type I restriction enzyme R subunit